MVKAEIKIRIWVIRGSLLENISFMETLGCNFAKMVQKHPKCNAFIDKTHWVSQFVQIPYRIDVK